METAALPDMRAYLDFREYLRAYRAARKEIDPGFTNTYICHRLGQVNSRGYFNNVLAGRIAVGPALVERFVVLLELTGEDAEFFRALVGYTQAREIPEREVFLAILIRCGASRSRILTERQAAYYGDWRHALVRAVLDIVDCDGEDCRVIAERLNVPMSADELRCSLGLLSELGLVAHDSRGFLKPVESSVSCGDAVARELVGGYQASLMRLSAEAIQCPGCGPQKVTTMTVSLSSEAYGEIVAKVDRLREEIRRAVQESAGTADRLYQINLHLFPQTKPDAS